MKEPNPSTPFSRAILTGLFLGIAATMVCFVYTVGYTMISGSPYTFLESVSFLIFACTLFVFVSSFFYFYSKQFLPRGEMIFVIAFILLTAFCLWTVDGRHQSTADWLVGQNKGLLSGIIIITGAGVFAGIPILYHNRGFQKNII